MALKALAGGTLFADRFGSGPARVLALHGWGRNRTDFTRILDGLDALALDLPGFGASPPPSEVMGAAGYAELIRPVLDEFGAPPVIVGHSFGGRVAVKLATASSTRGLVLTGVPFFPPGERRRPSRRFRMARWAYRLGALSEDRMEQWRRRYGSADYRAASGVMRGVLVKVVGESYHQELSNLSVPVRLVWGADDREVPVGVAERARAVLPDATLEVLPGAGHQLPMEAPLALRAAIEALLS